MDTSARNRRALRLVACAGVAALALTGCSPAAQGGGGTDGSRTTDDGRVAYLNLGGFSSSSDPKPNYNPYVGTAIGPMWTLYDPLFETNNYDCSEVPQLGTEYEWTSPTELRVTTREGVTWNDGEPFTAADVAFTYTLFRDYPALDAAGAGAGLVEAEAVSDTEVVLTYEETAYSRVQQILGAVIVPEHVWSGVDDPTTFTAEDAVGTGMFTVKSLNPQKFVVERNPNYWNADAVKVDELRFSQPADAQVDQLNLARGNFDQNAMFIPDIEEAYVAKDPEHNHYWFPGGAPISLFMNLTQEPFDDVEFRRAMTFAMDKERINDEANYSYVDQVASQTLLQIPGQEDWLDPDVPDKGVVAYDPDEADRILTDAGYELDAKGKRLGKDGKPLSFAFTTPNGWTNWTAAANLITEDLAKLGITVKVETPEFSVLEGDRAAGHFELTFGVNGGNCSMYQNYAGINSANTAPVGEQAGPNHVRFSDPHADEVLGELERAETPEEQLPLVHELQEVMLDQVPYIPLFYGGQWFEYRTEHATGWPSADDPYAAPSNQRLIYSSLEPAQD
jgi:peptide/nickel transport system substrate-binding protein